MDDKSSFVEDFNEYIALLLQLCGEQRDQLPSEVHGIVESAGACGRMVRELCCVHTLNDALVTTAIWHMVNATLSCAMIVEYHVRSSWKSGDPRRTRFVEQTSAFLVKYWNITVFAVEEA